jgi:hypothetical protein
MHPLPVGEMKKTMTLNLTPAEMEVLEQLAAKKDLSKTAVLRQALRLYQTVDLRIEEGDKLFFEGPNEEKKVEVMVL